MTEGHGIRPVHLDRVTVLMGSDATLTGFLYARPTDNGCKRFWVENWQASDDLFEWSIAVGAPGDYEVTALITGTGAEIEVRWPGGSLTCPIECGWDRQTLGILSLPEGVVRLSLKAPKPGRDLKLYALELLPVLARPVLTERVVRMRSNTLWMRTAKYGLQFHWTSQSQPRRGLQKSYETAVADFMVEPFARTVYESGAGYVILTTSHADYYFPGPITAIDRVMPGRTTQRDLVNDLADALGLYGIRLMLYYHVGHDHWREPDGWWTRCGFGENDGSLFIANWIAIISEIGTRYGDKLAGWFFDDGIVYYPLNPPFEKMTAAAKQNNPNRVVCYNPWILPRLTDYQDYFCGEGYNWLTDLDRLPDDRSGVFTDGPQQGLQAHTNFILEEDWVHSKPNTAIPPPSVDRNRFVTDMTGAIERGLVPSVNLEVYQNGTCSPFSFEYLLALRRRLQ